jgi:hypothetical protein
VGLPSTLGEFIPALGFDELDKTNAFHAIIVSKMIMPDRDRSRTIVSVTLRKPDGSRVGLFDREANDLKIRFVQNLHVSNHCRFPDVWNDFCKQEPTP